jgi:hypothetical protein
MKKTCSQIVLCRACKLRKKSHLSNVTFQWDHLSCLVCYMNQEKAKKIIFLFFWNIDKTIDHEISHILDEKTNFEVEFDNYSHAFVSIRSINWCRFTLLNILKNESKHIKHQVNFVNLDFQRFKTSFRVTSSSRFLWSFKSFDHEMHEKRHRFAVSLKVTIIQKKDERFKLRKMNKDHEKWKHFSSDQSNLNIDQFF